MKFAPQNKFIIRRWKAGDTTVEFLTEAESKLLWVAQPGLAHEFTAKKDARVVLLMLKQCQEHRDQATPFEIPMFQFDVKGLNELNGGRRNGQL